MGPPRIGHGSGPGYMPPEVVMEVVMEVDQGTPPRSGHGSGHLEVVTEEQRIHELHCGIGHMGSPQEGVMEVVTQK